MICRRVAHIKSQRETTSCKISSDKDSMATDGFHIRHLLNSDRRLTCDEILYELGISHRSSRLDSDETFGNEKE